ncbi:hypothetical protein CKO42_21710 [Lamprobacter modestohalophilus]|uniref:Calcineurin-like phosphoesterase domain-containing protein n=1 Tax=Lamprobacter modestohalophilus TaxID=1064514 RepID=A0A9X0WCP5_9GAMM|nr:metallophosphoesterase family protein [Lamprobacter modestohalophilus]MBK1620991.1 hypothetical protein [Lamprobacter modestohalophilus]
MLTWLQRPKQSKTLASAQTPPGVRIYAVGDIHGRADLLEQLQGQIEQDAARHPDKVRQLIYLGDYVDRGPQSREVLELLSRRRLPGVTSHCLLGNHDQAMRHFLRDPLTGAYWLELGGLATLLSYGVGVWSADPVDPADPPEIAAALRAAMPSHHQAFLQDLELSRCVGDFFFVHAGIRPRIPIAQQQPQDLIWIREHFLSDTKPHPYVVVHGHNARAAIELCSNRIGIDTGAYATGRLSCLILDGATRMLIDTQQGGPQTLPSPTGAR